MEYPSDCRVSPATTAKSFPAMARMDPPLEEYGSKRLFGWTKRIVKSEGFSLRQPARRIEGGRSYCWIASGMVVDVECD